MWSHSLLLSLLLTASAGCTCAPITDLGTPCTMRKPGPDGGTVSLLNRDISQSAGTEFVGFGTTDCEFQVCVRDANAAKLWPGESMPGSPAIGYCSTHCTPGGRACTPANLDDQNHTEWKLGCRQLALAPDPTVLDAGFFCARHGAVADAGI